MAQTNSRFFSVMVVGEDPAAILEDYRMDKKVEPYVKFKFLQADKYKEAAIKVSEKLLEDGTIAMITPQMKSALESNLKNLKAMSTFDYYRKLTEGMYYNENGDALTDKNPNGKWKTAHIGRNFSLPLILLDGMEVYSAKCSDVDWARMHLNNQEVYKAAWEMVMGEREPVTEEEKAIYEAMKDKEVYFSKFADKESYVNYSTAYWNFAYVDENGWVDMNNANEQEWINTFYDRFVTKINENATVTIYECTTNDDD
jgi:hypothetical protein